MPSSTLIDVLRHGEPLGGARYRGRTDDALSQTGWQQMTDAVNFEPVNKSAPWTQIISSPLSRCADFARLLSETHQLELLIEPRFAEIDFGDWEGLTSQQIMDHDSKQLLQYWDNPIDNSPPNGESLNDFSSRVIAAWNELLSEHAAADNKHLLIITHGGSLRIIMSHVLTMPLTALFKLDVPYACLSRFQHQHHDQQSQLIFHNGHAQ